jgi:hypothetical protein
MRLQSSDTSVRETWKMNECEWDGRLLSLIFLQIWNVLGIKIMHNLRLNILFWEGFHPFFKIIFGNCITHIEKFKSLQSIVEWKLKIAENAGRILSHHAATTWCTQHRRRQSIFRVKFSLCWMVRPTRLQRWKMCSRKNTLQPTQPTLATTPRQNFLLR